MRILCIKYVCVGGRVLQAPRPSPIMLNFFFELPFHEKMTITKFYEISITFNFTTNAI